MRKRMTTRAQFRTSGASAVPASTWHGSISTIGGSLAWMTIAMSLSTCNAAFVSHGTRAVEASSNVLSRLSSSWSSIRESSSLPTSSSSSSSSIRSKAGEQNGKGDDASAMRADIAAMRAEAEARLEALAKQMEALQQLQQQQQQHRPLMSTPTTTTTRETSSSTTTASSRITMPTEAKGKTEHNNIPSATGKLVGNQEERPQSKQASATIISETKEVPATARSSLTSISSIVPAAASASSSSTIASSLSTMPLSPWNQNGLLPTELDLLDDTRWKIVFNIGRETGTWMPPEWGASGDRLLFQVVVDFTSQPSYNREEFLNGIAGAKVLEVIDAWTVPRGVGVASQGRKPLPIQPRGAYKVAAGEGPMGTDLLRLYIELDQEVRPDPGSDLFCPAGRVYGTCGYFPIRKLPHFHPPGTVMAPSPKDMLAQEHRAALQRYEQLKLDMEQDSRGWMNWDKVKRTKELYQLKDQVKQLGVQLQQARQREPEKSQLRMARSGLVGLSKEGGICRKVHKGLALEYNILGRMELAAAAPHYISDEDDDHRPHHPVQGHTDSATTAKTSTASSSSTISSSLRP